VMAQSDLLRDHRLRLDDHLGGRIERRRDGAAGGRVVRGPRPPSSRRPPRSS
jgi:hypothetical protein